ncbi:MAG: stage II sporulation protein P, partial [Bacillota bacterium]
TREFLQGGPSKNRPPELLKGLANGDGDGMPKAGRRHPRVGPAVMTALLILGLSWAFFNHGFPTSWGRDETLGQKEFVMVDSHGQIITATGRIVNRGDEYIDEQNRHWRVYATKGYTAWAQSLGVIDLNQYIQALDTEIARAQKQRVLAAPPVNPKGRVGIYHSHNDESYVPTDGTSSIYGPGGIHKVGDAFEQALWARNITTVRSQSLHLPHDRGAYVRSRRTAAWIVQSIPDAVFDIHRDATPAYVYEGSVNGTPVTKINIVVGQQNVNRAQTQRIAAGLKSVSDSIYPGLVKGIFIARGNYNQDLYPTALLLEVGAHTNDRLAAERGIGYFADVVDRYLYGP